MLLARVRAVVFYLYTFILSVPLFVVMCLMAPFVFMTDRYK